MVQKDYILKAVLVFFVLSLNIEALSAQSRSRTSESIPGRDAGVSSRSGSSRERLEVRDPVSRIIRAAGKARGQDDTQVLEPETLDNPIFEMQSASKASINFGELPSLSSSRLQKSLDDFVLDFGEPSQKEILYIIVADGHGDLEARRKILAQAVEMKEYFKFKKIVLLDLGDRSNGSNLDEVASMDQVAREFGIPIEDHFGIPGNMEYRGQGELTLVHEREWRDRVLNVMQENTTLLEVTDENGNSRIASDTDIVDFRLFPGDLENESLMLAGHKPFTQLPSGSTEGERAIQRIPGLPFPVTFPYAVNLRNWLGIPIVASTVTLPAWTIGLLASPIPLRLNPKFIVPDVWRPFGSSLQLTWDILRLKALRQAGYRPPNFIRSDFSWKDWVQKDDRSIRERIQDRVQSIPRVDPETQFTMMKEPVVSDDVQVIVSAHTHRGAFIRKLMRSESGVDREILVIQVPPSFLDAQVPFGEFGFVSLIHSADGDLKAVMHNSSNGGAIEFMESTSPQASSEEFQIDPKLGHGAKSSMCRRMLGGLPKTGTLSDQFKRLGTALGARP